MPLTETVRVKIIRQYCLIFLLIVLYKYLTKGFLFQSPPFFFYNKLDFTTWLVMLTGIHKLFLNNKWLCFIVELFYCVLPFIYFATYVRFKRIAPFIGWTILVFNALYTLIYCAFPTDSLHGHIALILFPLVFVAVSLNMFWLLLNALRYFFLFFFASAGIWKIWQGGLFNINQMSGILIYQHKELLISSSPSPLLSLYRWLIVHPGFSYLLYFLTVITELFFLVGFFTKRVDRQLIFLYILFLIADAIVMRIDYWDTLPFLLTLFYSKYEMPLKE
jgi:hypothetical protein